MTTRIRPAYAGDREVWLRLRASLWPECPEATHRREIEQLLRSDGVVLLAEGEDGRALGYVEVSVRREHVEGASSSPVAYLEGWYVVPDARSDGVGRRLVEAAETWAWRRGLSELASDAELENTAAVAAHGRLGFLEVGRTVHFVKRLTP